METIQEIDKQIQALSAQRRQLEEATLNETLLQMFSAMTKEEILALIQGMMAQSPMLKMEVKRLLLDNKQGIE